MATTVLEKPATRDVRSISAPDDAARPRPHRWVPWAVGLIAAAAAALYLVAASDPNLHNYYTPAVVSMSESLHNFVYGAYDSAGWSGVDKIPGSLWPQALSVAIFGANAWAVVLPEVLATIATVVVLYLATTRWRGRIAGLVAAAVYATMPLAAALAKSNVPEVWFALALAIAAYFMVRALQTGSFWWLLATGLALSAGFQVKMLEAWMLFPAVAVAYLVAAPRGFGTRLWHTVAAGLVSIAASLWWIVLVTWTPAASRPWVGGTTDNSAWSMVFGYNGFGRVTGGEGSFVANFAGDAGLTRLVGPQVSVDVAWFLPLALIAVGIGILATARRRPRAALGGYLFFGLWLVVVTGVMTFSAGIHTFYVLAFAPAIAVLIGGLVAEGWETWRSPRTRVLAAVLVLVQAAWTTWLVLGAGEHLWLLVAVPVGAVIAVVLMLMKLRAGLAIAAAALLLAPAAWAIGSVSVANAINPSASSAQSSGGPGAGPAGDAARPAPPSNDGAPADMPSGGPIGAPSGGPGGSTGFDNAQAIELRDWLLVHSPDTAYLVAADSSTSGELALVETPGVITLGGGFNGSDPTPTAAELGALVESGQLRYVVVGQQGGAPGLGGPGGGTTSNDTATVTSERTAWITANCAVATDAPTSSGTVYDCTAS